jgi:16S rRNA G966 N2-methylase RsmD
MLKIAGVTAKGRRLDSPSAYLRHMMGKVSEAIYSSTLASFVLYYTESTRHLDIFSGPSRECGCGGVVGLESLSRGACHCPLWIVVFRRIRTDELAPIRGKGPKPYR